MMIMMIGLTQ
jgi:Rrf2 family cysteine metabolism transcriptional repressor